MTEGVGDDRDAIGPAIDDGGVVTGASAGVAGRIASCPTAPSST